MAMYQTYNNNEHIIQKLLEFLNNNNIDYERDVDLKKKTWIHRGGICSVFITPSDNEALQKTIQFIYGNNINFLVIGHTSNIYIINDCNISVIVNTARCKKFEILNDTILAECGTSVSQMAKELTHQGIEGFEHLHQLPGTVAGAIHNNSSCLNNSISSLLISATVVTEDGSVREMTYEDFNFKYRTSILKDKTLKGVIIKAKLKVGKGNADELEKIAANTNARRKKNLEGKAHNLGCTVNRCFCNGNMPIHYMLASRIYKLYVNLIEKDTFIRKKRYKDFICRITGYSHISNYISDKSIITFMWIDEGADKAFPDYIKFMREVFKTDKIEIEIIKNQ